MRNKIQGELFSEELSHIIKDKFLYVDNDPILRENRLFFDNAGGSLRLKEVNDIFQKIDALPDCSEHSSRTGKWLLERQEKGFQDLNIIYNTCNCGGAFVTALTASMVMFDFIGAIIKYIPGKNVVTTALEHPSSYDSVQIFASEYGKELRIAEANPLTGSADASTIAKLIDKDTCLLNVMYASNISGSVFDLEEIIKAARNIKPDLYITCDAVQHMPHAAVDLVKTPVDAMNFAPYKFFGVRGFGVGYLSERVAKLPHNRLLAKPVDEWGLGSPAPAHLAAISTIVDYVCFIGGQFNKSTNRRTLYEEGMNRINLHERALLYYMLNGTEQNKGLRNINGVTVYVDYEDLSKRDLIIAIGLKNLDYAQAVKEYEKEGVVVFERVMSSHYSSRMLKTLKIDGSIRISPLHCHTLKDIEKFLKITAKLANL